MDCLLNASECLLDNYWFMISVHPSGCGRTREVVKHEEVLESRLSNDKQLRKIMEHADDLSKLLG